MGSEREQSGRGRPSGQRVDGAFLRDLRQQLGLTQEKMAALAGVSVRTLQNTETGQPVSAETARALANALRIPVANLLVTDRQDLEARLLVRGLAPLNPPALWVGRADAVEHIISRLSEGAGICCIAGPPGAGKSALAAVVAARLGHRFERGTVWVNANRLRHPDSIQQVQRDIAAAFGFEDHLGGRDRPGEVFRASFWRPGRRLLILDDVADIDVLIAFYNPDRWPDSAVLLTTRHPSVTERLADGEILFLDSLTPDSAHELLVQGYDLGQRLASDPVGSRRLLELLDYSPRGLHIVGRLLQRERYTSPGELADRGQRDAAELRNAAELQATYDPDEQRDVHVLIPWLQLEEHVGTAAWNVFVSLAVFGEVEFPREWALALSQGQREDADQSIATLLEFSLVHQRNRSEHTLLYLDTQAALAARHVCGDNLQHWTRRLLDVALAEASRRAPSPDGLVSDFVHERDVWTHCLELGLADVRGEIPPLEQVTPDAGQLSAPAESLSERIPALMVQLARVLGGLDVPEAGRWLAAAILLGSEEVRRELAPTVGLWLARRLKLEQALRWFRLDAQHTCARPPFNDVTAQQERRIASAVAWPVADASLPERALGLLGRAFGSHGLSGFHGLQGLILDAAALPHERVRLAVRIAEELPFPRARLVATGSVEVGGPEPSGPLLDNLARGACAIDPEEDVIWLDAMSRRLLGNPESDVGWARLAGTAVPDRDDEHRAPLAGRDTELSALIDACERSAEGQSAGRLVTGVAGIGKSRLVQEMIVRLRQHQSFLLLAGRADPLHGAYPYELLGSVLRQMTGVSRGVVSDETWQRWSGRLGRYLQSGRDRVAAFLGEMAGVTRPLSETHPRLRAARRDTRLMREQLRAVWLEWLVAECREDPVVLFLDDVQWADTASLGLLELTRRRLQNQRLMIVGTMRAEGARNAAIEGVWPPRDQLGLGPLDRQAGRTLVEHYAATLQLRHELQETLVQQADGHPLLLEELIRSVSDGTAPREHLDPKSDQAVLGIIQARHARLPARSRLLLRVASVLGERFEADEVHALMDPVAPDEDEELQTLLKRLCQEDVLLRDTAAQRSEYRFRHGLMRDAAYSMLTEEDRVTTHRRTAALFESRGNRPPFVLAQHYLRGEQPQQAAPWFLRAAESALRLDDNVVALETAEQGLACSPADRDVEAALHVIRAEALRAHGEHRAAELAIADLERPPRPGSAFWYRALRLTSWTVRDRNEYVHRWHELLDVEPEASSSARAEAVVTLARAAANMDPEGLSDAATQLLAKAEALLEQLGDEALVERVYVHQTQAVRHGARGEHDRAVFHWEQGMSVARQAGSERLEVSCRSELGFALSQLGELERAVELLEDGVQKSLQGERLGSAAFARVCLGSALLALGDFARAESALTLALEWCLDNQDSYLEGHCRRFLAHLERNQGNLDTAERHARRAVECAVATPSMRAGVVAELAATLVEKGAAEQAVRMVEETCADLSEIDTFSLGLPELMLVRFRALRACGDDRRAEAARTEALALVDELTDRVAPQCRETMLSCVPALHAIRRLKETVV